MILDEPILSVDLQLLVNERNDFAIRCQKCHKSTYFYMILKDQIDSWNNGDTPCVIDELN